MLRPTTLRSSALPARSKATPPSLKVEDFWDVAALDRAVAKLGKK